MARNRNRARAGSPLNLPSAWQLFKPSKNIVLKNIWIFGPLYVVPLIFSLHSWLWSPSPAQGQHWTDRFDSFSSGWSFAPFSAYTWSAFIGLTVLWLSFVIIAGTIAQIMAQTAQLDAVEGKRLDFQDLWKVVKEIGWRMLGLYLVVGLCIVIGLILFIIPGLIMIRRYFLSSYVMIDRRCGIREAMDGSDSLTKKHPRAIFGILGVMILFSLVAIVPFVGSLVAFILGALYSVAPALRYQQLKRIS